MTLQNFFAEHGRLLQMVCVGAVVLAAGWYSRRAQPKIADGWTHSHYPFFVKLLTLMFAAFMTAAVAYNGKGLFTEDWWVAPVIVLMTLAAYLFLAEVFLASLRWTNTEVELRRFPFARRSLKLQDVVASRNHSTTESVTLMDKHGAKLWFPYGYRGGVSGLFALLGKPNAELED